MKNQFAMTNILTNQTVRGNKVKDSSKLRKKILINQVLCQVKDPVNQTAVKIFFDKSSYLILLN